MDQPARDFTRWVHQSGHPSFVLVDFLAKTIGSEGTTTRSLDDEALGQLRVLALEVRPEHASLQPRHVTYAQDEALRVVLGEHLVHIVVSAGEITVGPTNVLLEAMRALLSAVP